jgi:Tc5 transposase DNA-binding domain
VAFVTAPFLCASVAKHLGSLPHLQNRAAGLSISDDMLISKAKQLADCAKIDDFTGTSGWLQKFKKRYSIRSKGLHGDAADADAQGVEHSQRCLPVLISELGFSKEDVFNFDETGLYFKATPKRTLLRGECTGLLLQVPANGLSQGGDYMEA